MPQPHPVRRSTVILVRLNARAPCRRRATCGAIGPGSTGTSAPLRKLASVASTHSRGAPPTPGRCGTARSPADRRGPARRRPPSARTSTPTYGARSVLLTTSTSARAMPGSALAGDVSAAGHVEHEELRVHQRRGEGRGQVVAAGLDQHHVDAGRSRAPGPRRPAGSASRRRGSRCAGRRRSRPPGCVPGSSTPADRRKRASSSV